MTLESILVNLGIGIICTLIGALVGYRLAISKEKHNDRASIVRDVSEKYRDLVEKHETDGFEGFLSIKFHS